MNKTNKNQIVLYEDKQGNVELRADVKKDTLWATQAQIAVIFDVNTQAITKHLKNIYRECELSKRSTCSKMEQVQLENNRMVKRSIEFYNLDAVIAVGYRVNSKKATMFRIWATGILRDYLVKGFNLDKRQFEVDPQKLDDLHKAIKFLESKERGGKLKAKVFVRMSRDMLP